MDGERFDHLARTLAGGLSRRSVLRGLAAGLAGGLAAAVGATSAAGCRAVGRTCREDANCCVGTCRLGDDGRRRCACPAGAVACRGACATPSAFQTDPSNCGGCGNACPDAACQRATCVAGVCGLEPNPAAVGKRCDDGDACTSGDVCLANGTCAGSPTTCPVPNDCYRPGACSPATGCADPTYRGDGATCAGGNCQSGACVACTSDASCSHLDDPCADGVCNLSTGRCESQAKAEGSLCDDGLPCTAAATCQAGTCTRTATKLCPAAGDCQSGPGVCDEFSGNCTYGQAGDYTPCGAGGEQFCCNGSCCGQDLLSCDAGVCSGVCIPTGAPCSIAFGLNCCSASCDSGTCR